MLRRWQDDVNGDPLPWLLADENPSARYLTLRHLLHGDERDTQTAEARAAIQTWAPVDELLSLMDPISFWGRAEKPFYGGAMSTHATLHLLAELGLPRLEQLTPACESLLTHGQHESGGFSYDGVEERILLCHTGNAIRTLVHFGYRDDARVQRAFQYLVARSSPPSGLTCPYADGEVCQWGITKALGAFAALPRDQRTPEQAEAIGRLADAVLDFPFDFEERHADWLAFGFPLDYQSDLTELCNILARLDYGPDPRFERLLAVMMAAQSEHGRWIKRFGTRALQVEDRGKPSKWITFRALQALKHTHRAILEATRAELESTTTA